MELRPEVRAFAEAIERRLRANDHKPGWKHDSLLDLFAHFLEEVSELAQEAAGFEEQREPRASAHVEREAADVAAMAMMIWDVARRRAGPGGRRNDAGEG